MQRSIFDFLEVQPASACWLYRGQTLPSGHGSWHSSKGIVYAHVQAWHESGKELPVGMSLVHANGCVNPICCNPAHWQAVLPFTNTIPNISLAPEAYPIPAKKVFISREVIPQITLNGAITDEQLEIIRRGEAFNPQADVKVKPGIGRRIRALSDQVVREIRNSPERTADISVRLNIPDSTIGRVRSRSIYSDVV